MNVVYDSDGALDAEHAWPPGAQPEPELEPDLLLRRADVLGRGIDADDIKRRLARHEWQVVRRGVYARTSAVDALTAMQLHRLRIEATAPQLGEHCVVSHMSAACLHGIELVRLPGRAVQVTNPIARSGHRRRVLQTYCAKVDVDEITKVDGIRVTTVARTIIDIARTCGFEQGVVAADHALHNGCVTPDELVASAARASRRSGIRTAHQVIAFAESETESVGESRSRVLMAREGLPAPEVQFRLLDRSGFLVARSDFRWREFNTVGEFDGAEKYGRWLGPGQRPGDAVFQEKLREDRIREHGFNVVRWTWDELDDPHALAGKIRRALARGRSLAS